jgi:type I restriction enzyme M protein
MVPYKDIKAEGFVLSLSRYKRDVFEEIEYEVPGVILDRLIRDEVGELDASELTKLQGGIVGELLDLKGMVG